MSALTSEHLHEARPVWSFAVRRNDKYAETDLDTDKAGSGVAADTGEMPDNASSKLNLLLIGF